MVYLFGKALDAKFGICANGVRCIFESVRFAPSFMKVKFSYHFIFGREGSHAKFGICANRGDQSVPGHGSNELF